jgi:hypothetical protein
MFAPLLVELMESAILNCITISYSGLHQATTIYTYKFSYIHGIFILRYLPETSLLLVTFKVITAVTMKFRGFRNERPHTFGRYIPTFWRYLLPPSSGNICALEMEAPGFSETRVCIDPVTWHQTQGDRNPNIFTF